VVLLGTKEHGTPEHRNILEHPGTPPIPGTFTRKPRTPPPPKKKTRKTPKKPRTTPKNPKQGKNFKKNSEHLLKEKRNSRLLIATNYYTIQMSTFCSFL